jgi:uncharacterized protein (DUF3820 family)
MHNSLALRLIPRLLTAPQRIQRFMSGKVSLFREMNTKYINTASFIATTQPTMSISYKRQKLEEFLGPLEEYYFTGWMFPNSEDDTSDEKKWVSRWKNVIYPLSGFSNEFPTLIRACHCSTPIIWNCLVKHKVSGRVEFVGSICADQFKMLARTCIQCHAVNRCKTSRCASCRKYCDQHKTYHDDNSSHQEEVEATPEWKVRALEKVEGTPEWFRRAREENEKFERMMEKPFGQRELQFGKWEGYNPDSLIGVADEYLQWYIGTHDEFLITVNDIKPFLMRTKACFGKYKGRSFGCIKANDPAYYNWIKRTIDKPFVKYLS